VLDVAFTWSDAYAVDGGGWHFLTGNAKTAA
jgi:hypothetical protein